MAEQAATNPCTQSAEVLANHMFDVATYPRPATDLRMTETYLSWVFLAGESTHKVHKLTKLDFADFSTLLAQ